jgi:DNA invertase Pin-like site-specific DNA recombinase
MRPLEDRSADDKGATNMVRAAIYARSATDERAALVLQEARCRVHAAVQGWEVVNVWVDVGSGLAPTLPGLASLLTSAEAGEVDAVVTLRVDRFSRRFGLATAIERRFQVAGVEVAFVEGDCPPYAVAMVLKNWSGSETMR